MQHARRYSLVAYVAAPQRRARQVSARFLGEFIEVRVRRGDVKLGRKGEGVRSWGQVRILTEYTESSGGRYALHCFRHLSVDFI